MHKKNDTGDMIPRSKSFFEKNIKIERENEWNDRNEIELKASEKKITDTTKRNEMENICQTFMRIKY